jgi:acetyltransferase
MGNKTPDIGFLFEPRTVAIVGASQDRDKIGYQILDNVLHGKFRGAVYPVNPKGGEILGRPVVRSVSEIEGDLDIAVIAIPAHLVFSAVQQCAEKKVRTLVIITSGFSEIGNLEEERRIVSFAQTHGMRVLGPNIFGIYSSIVSLNATFGPKDIKPGHVAIISQSGALGSAMIGKTKSENIGLSAIISVGNKSDIDEADLLEYLVRHDETKVIMMYIEGIKKGGKLVEMLTRTTRKKPVVIIKSGRSKRGALAAASHTGSLAGADEIFSDIMKQCGVMRAESIQDAFNWCRYLSEAPMPVGEDVVIITNGGGLGVLAADACEKHQVTLYDDTDTMKKIFSKVVPEFGSVKNPVDLTGGASIENYEKALDAALGHGDVHSVICLGCEAAGFDPDKLPASIARIYRQYRRDKPMVFSFFGGEKIEKAINELRNSGIPIFSDVYEAVSCQGVLYANLRTIRERMKESGRDGMEEIDIDYDRISAILKKVRREKRTFLLAYEGNGIMKAADIRMPDSRIAHNLDQAVLHAETIGYPVVMKVVSKDIIHKSDVGGIALDLENRKELIDGYEAILYNCRRHCPEAHIEGIEVVEMAGKGLETIVGARRDGSFGPTVMFGLGGIYVEVMKDVTFRAFPLRRKDALNMLSDVKSYPLLLGVRGEDRKDINRVIDTILKVGAVLNRFKAITDIEINPLIVYDEGMGVKALDVRILLSKTREES